MTNFFCQNIAALENTHRQFELAVQEAELVLPEPSDLQSGYPLSNSNSITHTAKIHNTNDDRNPNTIRPRNSTTRSDIESDSGIESINSDLQRHQFQNSPLYSPIGMYPKNHTSTSPYMLYVGMRFEMFKIVI